MRNAFFSAAFAVAVGLASAFFAPANAAPASGALAGVKSGDAGIQQVNYRGYYHCHRRHGRRWCHDGDYGYYDGYYPGVYLNFGGNRHGHRHRGHSHRGSVHRGHRGGGNRGHRGGGNRGGKH